MRQHSDERRDMPSLSELWKFFAGGSARTMSDWSLRSREGRGDHMFDWLRDGLPLGFGRVTDRDSHWHGPMSNSRSDWCPLSSRPREQ